MIGFRKINGANWLDRAQTKIVIDKHGKTSESLNKLPLHWNKVRNILLNNH